MPDLVSVPGLAVRLRLPPRWIREAAKSKKIPSLRVGKKLLFNVDAVEHALAKLAAKEVDGRMSPAKTNQVGRWQIRGDLTQRTSARLVNVVDARLNSSRSPQILRSQEWTASDQLLAIIVRSL